MARQPCSGLGGPSPVCRTDSGRDTDSQLLVAVDVVVVAAVGADRLRLAPRPAGPASDWRDGIEQEHERGDIVAVARAPLFARTEAASVITELQSRPLRAPISSRITRCRRRHTPDVVQTENLR